jgi:penicillin-binding protein 1A
MPVWKPKNWDNKFMGTMTLRKGLEKSRNSITVRVGQIAGLRKIAETFKRFGINDNPSPKIHSIVLGALETTLERMTMAYSIIANKGRKVTPHYIELIKDRKGNVLYRRDYTECMECKEYKHDETGNALLPIIPVSSGHIITDDATDYQITSILMGAIQRGTGQAAKIIPKVIAGKTGTSNEGKDTWFIGFTPRIVVGTYIGYDIPRSLGKSATGATVALPIFINFMNNGYKDIESVDFEIPKSINLIPVNYDTGKPSTEKGSIIEAFKANYYDTELKNLESKTQLEDFFDPFSKIQDNIILPKEDPSEEIY